uniref:Transmembrane protein 231 n=1 Tax=Strongyloides venezuelensis TaxID=75913 RepID=A0A0K0EV51_STRVS
MSHLSEIYTIPVVKRYVSTTISMSNFIKINFKLISLILPLLLSMGSFGFWWKVNFYNEQPKIKFTKSYLISINLGEKNIFWSTYQNYNKIYKSNLMVPSLRFIEMDSNFDKIIDSIQIDMTFENVTKNDNRMGRIFFAFLFDTILDYRIDWNYGTFVMGEYIISVEGIVNKVTCEGDLYLESLNEFVDMNDKGNGIVDILNTTDITITWFKKYVRDKKYSLVGRKFYCDSSYQENSSSTNLSFTYNIPEQIIFYKTTIFEIIKWALIQYITFTILIRSLLSQFLKFLCLNNCLDAWCEE